MPPPPSRPPPPPPAFARGGGANGERHEEGLVAAGGAAAATLTPATAACRASFDSPGRRAAAGATFDVEAGSAPSASTTPLLEPVPLADRVTLEFQGVDCAVPRLFGAGAPGGALQRSATFLRAASTIGSRKGSSSAAAAAAARKEKATRQVGGGDGRGGARVGHRGCGD